MDSDTESQVADPRVLSVRSRMLQISGPARAPVPARRVLALGGRPVDAPISKMLQIPGGSAQRVLLRILVGGEVEGTTFGLKVEWMTLVVHLKEPLSWSCLQSNCVKMPSYELESS